MRKRKWLPEYKCEKLGTYIIEKIRWCNESLNDCEECIYKKGYKTDEDYDNDKIKKTQHKKQLRRRRTLRKSTK